MTQRRIGLTGGIGMGKTTVSNYLTECYQLPVLDADLLARKAVEPGTEPFDQIVKRYGAEILLPEGCLNRAQLGSLIFKHPEERHWLEQQIHPYVRQQLQQSLQHLPGDQFPIVVLVIPLLFEAHMTDLVTEIWVLRTDLARQMTRLQARDPHLSQTQLQDRINSQMAIEEKVALADIVLDNSSSLEVLFAQVDLALQLQKKSEQ